MKTPKGTTSILESIRNKLHKIEKNDEAKISSNEILKTDFEYLDQNSNGHSDLSLPSDSKINSGLKPIDDKIGDDFYFLEKDEYLEMEDKKNLSLENESKNKSLETTNNNNEEPNLDYFLEEQKEQNQDQYSQKTKDLDLEDIDLKDMNLEYEEQFKEQIKPSDLQFNQDISESEKIDFDQFLETDNTEDKSIYKNDNIDDLEKNKISDEENKQLEDNLFSTETDQITSELNFNQKKQEALELNTIIQENLAQEDLNINQDKMKTQLQINYPSFKDSIIKEDVARKANDSIKTLIDSFPQKIQDPTLTKQSLSVEDLVLKSLEPKLSEWLNENLSLLVEKVVREEIKKIIPKD